MNKLKIILFFLLFLFSNTNSRAIEVVIEDNLTSDVSGTISEEPENIFRK